MSLKIFNHQNLQANENIALPFLNFYKEHKYLGNILKNNFYPKEKKTDLERYLRNKFFSNNQCALQCPNKSLCEQYSHQNDFEYNLCLETQPLNSISKKELILFICFFLLIINVFFI